MNISKFILNYKVNKNSAWQFIRPNLPVEQWEEYCIKQNYLEYDIEDLSQYDDNDIEVYTICVHFNDKYYLDYENIPYPDSVPKYADKFEVTLKWENENEFCNKDYDEIYNGEMLWTNVIARFSANFDMDEVGIVAQQLFFIKSMPEFLENLKKNNFAVYDNIEYSTFKWLCWIKDDKVRIIHQDYRYETAKTEFDILVDKEIFFNACKFIIKEMKKYAKSDLERYQNYALQKYGKIKKRSIPYPNTKPLDIGKFEIRLDINYDNEDDFESIYKSGDEMFTPVYTYLTLTDKEEEVVLIAQDFSKNFPSFLIELENIENAVYDEYKYKETKLYGWIKGDKVRLTYQDFSDDKHEIIFDVMVDKTWFFDEANKMIELTKEISESEEERYNEYVKRKNNK